MSAYPFTFVHDVRLGVTRPILYVDYDELPREKREEFELKCQACSASIPQRIKELEREYLELYEGLANLDEEDEFLRGMDQLNELSRRICDLNLLYLQIEGTYLAANVHA